MKKTYFLILLSACLLGVTMCNLSNCSLPQGCRFDWFYFIHEGYLHHKEYFAYDGYLPKGFICEVKSANYRFAYDIASQPESDRCDQQPYPPFRLLEWRFKKSEKKIIARCNNFYICILYFVYLLYCNFHFYHFYSNYCVLRFRKSLKVVILAK